MNEFEEKDYEGARSYADNIKTNAENIMNIFNEINNIMGSLYGEDYSSTGAETAKARYDEIKQNYDVFYEKVVAMRDHVYAITEANEMADEAASQVISEV